MRALVYALGGGAGHATRGAQLARALEGEGVPACVWVAEGRVGHARRFHHDVVGCERPGSPRALRRALDALLDERRATHLVVDTFAEGLFGELADARPALPSALVVRARRDGRSEALLRAIEAYDARFDVEAALGWLPRGIATPTPPVVRPLVRAPSAPDVVLAAGTGELSPLFARLGARLAKSGLRVERRDLAGAPLDAGDLSARVVVGAAGYNLTYELAELGTWHVAVPLRRRLDDQHARARAVAVPCDGPEALERRVHALLEGRAERAPLATESPADLARRILARWT